MKSCLAKGMIEGMSDVSCQAQDAAGQGPVMSKQLWYLDATRVPRPQILLLDVFWL